MSIPASPSVLLNTLTQAQNDLAFYAAIIGHNPGVADPAPQPAVAKPAEAEEPIPAAPHSRRISVWMHHISDQARRRLHEAKMRLAS